MIDGSFALTFCCLQAKESLLSLHLWWQLNLPVEVCFNCSGSLQLVCSAYHRLQNQELVLMGVYSFKTFVCKWKRWIGPNAAAKVHGHACSMCQRKMSKPIYCSRLRVFNPSVTVQALSEYSTGCWIKSGQRHFTSTVPDVFTLMIPQEILKHYLQHWTIYFSESAIVISFGQAMPCPQSEVRTF